MSLKDLVDRRSEISGPDGVSFQVRGLSLEDVVLLLENHKEALMHIFSSSKGADMAGLIKSFPEFVAAAIAYAADEHELEPLVMKLPVGLQLKAMQEVWDLSVMDVETLGKLATNMLQGMSKLNAGDLADLKTNLKAGSKVSQEQPKSSSPTDTDTKTSSDTLSEG